MPPTSPPILAALALTTLALLAAGLVLAIRRRRSRLVLDDEPPAAAPQEQQDVRVLRRQVDVLTQALREWEGLPPSPSPSPAGPPPPPDVVWRRDSCPTRAAAEFADLSRRLAAEGDLAGAVQAQWASDLQALGPHLGERGAALRDLVADLEGTDPRRVLLASREAALHLVDRAGGVRTLLGPTDHLTTVPARSGPAGSGPAGDGLRPEVLAVLGTQS